MNDTLTDRNELRDKIHEYLREKDLKTRIKTALSSKESKRRQKIHSSEIAADEDNLLKILHQQRIIDELLSHLALSDDTKKTESIHENFKELQQNGKTDAVESSLFKDQNVYKLEIRIKQGRAFVECLLDPSSVVGQPLPTLTIHGHFQGQRSKSTPVPAVCEPDFFCTLSFDLHAKTKEIDCPVHLVLVRTEPYGENKLMSSCFLDWRKVLTSSNGCLSIHTEFKGIGVENKVPIGVLDIELSINPTPKSLLTEGALNIQLSVEKAQHDEKQILFLMYSKLWWQEYLEIRPEHSLRLVKIFTQDENATVHPVVCYVRPLRVGRLIESPQEALWFVSLFHQQKSLVVGKIGLTKQEQWNSLFAFLVVQTGGSEDCAVFLCSLLLGFGLNAYVCIGTVSKEVPHAWVITFGRTDITFWDVPSATRYKHCSAQKECSKTLKPKHPFQTVDCIFNHQGFFANCQPTNSVERCYFDLSDPSKWKSMSTDAIALISTTIPSWPTILASTIDVSKASLDLEEQLKVLITEHRADKGLSTYWDENLCFVLSSALSTYEIQGRSAGVPAYHEDFQDAVHSLVPEGHTFKALPVHFCHKNAWKVFKVTLRSTLGEEIICCRGDEVRMAVRAHVYAYPENILSVWIMFSTKYKCIM